MDNSREFVEVNLSTPTIMTFYFNNKEMGRIFIQYNELKFRGKADVSAKIFMDKFLKPLVDDYIKEKLVSVN